MTRKRNFYESDGSGGCVSRRGIPGWEMDLVLFPAPFLAPFPVLLLVRVQILVPVLFPFPVPDEKTKKPEAPESVQANLPSK